MYTNIFSFGEGILSEYYGHDLVLSNSMAWSMKLRYCVFNKLFYHWHDILNCSYKCLF